MRLALIVLIIGASHASVVAKTSSTMNAWFNWMQALKPDTRDFDVPGIPLTKNQRNIERVFQVIFTVNRNCGSLDYGIDTRPFTAAVSRWIGHEWPIWAAFGPRKEDRDHPDVNAEVDEAFASDGKALCEVIAKRLGTGGDLVPVFEQFTADNEPGEMYEDRVMWRPKDICSYPEKYWASQWTDPTNQPELEDMRKRICGVAGVAP